LSENPLDNVVAGKATKKSSQVLTTHEIELLLEQPECIDLKGYRDKAMLDLMCSTGMKVSELIALNKDDVNLSAGLVTCRGKGKECVIPICPATVKVISEYIDQAWQQIALPFERALFVNMDGERISRWGFLGIVKFYQKKAHIEKEITPRTLRNSFAAHLMESGMDQRSLTGMKFLPPPTIVPECFRPLGFTEIPADSEEVKARFKLLAKQALDALVQLQAATQECIRKLEETHNAF